MISGPNNGTWGHTPHNKQRLQVCLEGLVPPLMRLVAPRAHRDPGSREGLSISCGATPQKPLVSLFHGTMVYIARENNQNTGSSIYDQEYEKASRFWPSSSDVTVFNCVRFLWTSESLAFLVSCLLACHYWWGVLSPFPRNSTNSSIMLRYVPLVSLRSASLILGHGPCMSLAAGARGCVHPARHSSARCPDDAKTSTATNVCSRLPLRGPPLPRRGKVV